MKLIYKPKGRALEFAPYALNIFNGCSGRCEYCYNRHGVTAATLGTDIPTVKKSIGTIDT